MISVDNDGAKIAALERGEVPIHERFLPKLLSRHRTADAISRATASTKDRSASPVSDCDVLTVMNSRGVTDCFFH
jgi:UDP-glucose 6-dehydrogenase